MKKYVLFLTFLFLIQLFASEKSGNTQVRAYRTSETIKLDGILNEAVYKNKPVSDFT